MRLRRTLLVAVIGFGLPLAGVAAPAQAAMTNTPTTQCQTLLTCVVPIVTGLTGTLVTAVPTVIKAVPQILGSVPATLSNLLGTNHTTPPSRGQKPPHHSKPPVTKAHHPTKTPPKTSAAHTTAAPKKAAIPTHTVAVPKVIPTAPTPRPNPIVQLVRDVGHVAQQVVSLFGWNLLALIPMAGIAFVISRRMAVSRRSASGLL